MSQNIDLGKAFNYVKREAGLPPKALKAAAREFKRLKKMSAQMPEYPMLRHYLELVAELPWNKVAISHCLLINSFLCKGF